MNAIKWRAHYCQDTLCGRTSRDRQTTTMTMRFSRGTALVYLFLILQVCTCGSASECPESFGAAHKACKCSFSSKSANWNTIRCDFRNSHFDEIPRLVDLNKTISNLYIIGNHSVRAPKAVFAQIKVSIEICVVKLCISDEKTDHSKI